MKTLSPGTVSLGTLKPSDLIRTFVSELEALGADLTGVDPCPEHGLGGDDQCLWCSEVLDDLFNLMDEHTPEGYYFGAAEGDGADFGVWPNPEK